MEDLFNLLSSSARFEKKKSKAKTAKSMPNAADSGRNYDGNNKDDNDDDIDDENDMSLPAPGAADDENRIRSRDRTGKRDLSEQKQRQIHLEKIAAFRRSMNIRLSNKHNVLLQNIPDPISSFSELVKPSWWWRRPRRRQRPFIKSGKVVDAKDEEEEDDDDVEDEDETFPNVHRAIMRNIEAGRWKEPTPIQMQAIPTLMERHDFIGAAPTGSGKSGAFIIPTLFLSSAPHDVFYNSQQDEVPSSSKNKKKKQQKDQNKGSIRALVVAPSMELASQLHREVERLGMGKAGGLSALLLGKANAAHVIAGTAGCKHGLDVLISTPLRLVDSIEKGLKLNSVRIVVLDEADRLLDAADGGGIITKRKRSNRNDDSGDEEGSSDDEAKDTKGIAASGSTQTKTFLAQMDVILGEIPISAVRALFSATVTPTVRSLAESILRNPVDVTIGTGGNAAHGGVNTDIDQKLTFVSNEQGKLLAIRQLAQTGGLRPPAIVFLQSQERAQALFEELLYDNIHVDVIHAGRSKAAREKAVAKFRKGDTWVLICTDLVARGVDFRAVNMVINYDLPESGITYVHRIGRTGRAGRKGTAITFFTESDFDNLRTIANIMRQSGCHVEDWMLNMKRQGKRKGHPSSHSRGHDTIDTTSRYEKMQKRRKEQIIRQSKEKKAKAVLKDG